MIEIQGVPDLMSQRPRAGNACNDGPGLPERREAINYAAICTASGSHEIGYEVVHTAVVQIAEELTLFYSSGLNID
jgi:hypothetical protein